MTTTPTRSERIEGGLIGLLVGDALGVPYEFHPPEALPPAHLLEMTPPPGFPRAHAGVPPGTYSDDGAHALCLLATLLQQERLDLENFGRRLVDWLDRGDAAVDYKVFDVGIQTRFAISKLRAGTPAHESGPSTEQHNGNGSLMRVLPLALWHQGSDAELVADARLQSIVTHAHLRSQLCCALYCLWARAALEGKDSPWEEATGTLRRLYPEGTRERAELDAEIQPDTPSPGSGTGYVVDCLRSARDVVKAGDYERVVKSAIALGFDTDTTAAVAGGFAGVRDGIQSIPKRWRQALRGAEWYQPLLEHLLARDAGKHG